MDVFQTTNDFRRVEYDERNFVLTASHGWSFIPIGQDIRIRVVAKGTQTTDVIIESTNKFSSISLAYLSQSVMYRKMLLSKSNKNLLNHERRFNRKEIPGSRKRGI